MHTGSHHAIHTRTVWVALGIGVLAGGFIAGYATAAQPHMMNALNALQTARAELVAAEPNKAGHREVAIERVDQAINQVKLGMAAAGG
jgi:hypothetical protein